MQSETGSQQSHQPAKGMAILTSSLAQTKVRQAALLWAIRRSDLRFQPSPRNAHRLRVAEQGLEEAVEIMGTGTLTPRTIDPVAIARAWVRHRFLLRTVPDVLPVMWYQVVCERLERALV